jgi:hypothetical protein
MELVTSRTLDRDDPLLSLIDGRTDLLMIVTLPAALRLPTTAIPRPSEFRLSSAHCPALALPIAVQVRKR